MGLGIKARALHKKNPWRNHLRISRRFFSEHLENASGTIAVIGIGRAFDFPLALLKNFSKIALIDADPLALFCLRIRCFAAGIQSVSFVCTDVTGVIDRIEELYKSVKNGSPRPIDISDGESISLKNVDAFDYVVSLNLLGQIPVYFHDRLEKLHHGDSSFEEAYAEIKDYLQKAHLKLLHGIAKKKILITCDREFYQYDSSECQGEKASSWEEEESLSDDTQGMLLPALMQTWLWHVEPGNTALDGLGSIHRVGAFVFEK